MGGFTLVEMLATVAVLIIVLGLMVSLARYVRRQSAERLTKDLLRKLDVLTAQYQAHYHGLPPVSLFVTPEAAAEFARMRQLEIDVDTSRRRLNAAETDAQRRQFARALSAAEQETASVEGALEQVLQNSGRANNQSFVQTLKREAGLASGAFGSLPVSIYDEATLRDAWGTPLVFMPAGHPSIGTALRDQPFFLSAGPDGQFHTLEDNLYSYEEGGGEAR